MDQHVQLWFLALLVVIATTQITCEALWQAWQSRKERGDKVNETLSCYSEIVGDGIHTHFRINHNLASRDAIVAVYDKDSGSRVPAQITKSDANSVEIETGRFTRLSTSITLGPLRIPRINPKVEVNPASIPEPQSLKVVIVA